MDLDQIDRRILSQMQKNADLPNTKLARLVGLSPSACLRRVARLKADGVIRSIVATIDPAHLNRRLGAIVTVKFDRHGPEFRRDFIKMVQSEPAVSQCYMVSGELSCVLVLHVVDMEEYTNLADQLFHSDRNVATFTTHFVMNVAKLEPAMAV